MSNSLPFDLSSQQFNVHEIYNKQDGEMIGYFLQSRPGIVIVENLRLVPFSEKSVTTPGVGDLSCSSQNVTSEDSKDIDNKKEIISELDNEVEAVDTSGNETKIEKYFEDEPVVKSPISTHNIMLVSPKRSPGSNKIPDMSDLMKPGSEGWRRECAMKKGKVTKVYYLSPPDREGNSKRLTCIKNCLGELGSESKLSSKNFSFVNRPLGLPSDVEIIREALLKCNGKKITFKEYYIETDKNTANGKMLVECKLCSQTVSYTTFSIHMRKYHLPDETCPACGFEIPSLKMANHIKSAHMAKTRGQSVLSRDGQGYDMLSIIKKQVSTGGDHNYNYQSSLKTTNIEDLSIDQDKTVDNPDQKNVLNSSLETPLVEYMPKSEWDTSSAVSPDIELGMSIASVDETTLLTNKPIDKLTEDLSVEDNDNNLVCDTNMNENCFEVTHKNIKDVSHSTICTSKVPDNVCITFVCSDPKSRKKVRMAGNIPVSKAVKKYSRLIGLSIEDFTFKSGNFLLTGMELTENLPSCVVLVDRK